MGHGVFEEDQVHVGAANGLVVLALEGLQALGQRFEGDDWLVDFWRVHVSRAFRLVASWFWRVAHKINKIRLRVHHVHLHKG